MNYKEFCNLTNRLQHDRREKDNAEYRIRFIKSEDIDHLQPSPSSSVFENLSEGSKFSALEAESLFRYMTTDHNVFSNEIIKSDIIALLSKIKLIYPESMDHANKIVEMVNSRNKSRVEFLRNNNRKIEEQVNYARENFSKTEEKVNSVIESSLKNIDGRTFDLETDSLVVAYLVLNQIKYKELTNEERYSRVDTDSIRNLGFNQRLKMFKSLLAIVKELAEK